MIIRYNVDTDTHLNAHTEGLTRLSAILADAAVAMAEQHGADIAVPIIAYEDEVREACDYIAENRDCWPVRELADGSLSVADAVVLGRVIYALAS